MKKLSRPLQAGAVVLFAAIALTGCVGEKPVEVKQNTAPVSEAQKSVKVTDVKKTDQKGEEYRTGWTQLENSIEVSLSGPKDCLPAVDHATRDGKTVSIWLKANKSDCSNEQAIAYSTIEDAKDIEDVEVYEAGYDTPFKIFKK
jgi:hypothetical protein